MEGLWGGVQSETPLLMSVCAGPAKPSPFFIESCSSPPREESRRTQVRGRGGGDSRIQGFPRGLGKGGRDGRKRESGQRRKGGN